MIFSHFLKLKVNPFKSSIPTEKLRSILNDLEKQDFLEILDDQSNNIRYRFTSPFMREVIYQRMIYNQRRVLHRYVAEAIQAIPLFSLNHFEEKLECDRLIYHWCLAENKDPFIQNALEDPFSNKAKRSIIVKKISSLLSKNPNNLNVIIKKGDLDKKSDRGYKWSSRYCVMNTREFKYYYSEEDYARKDPSLDEPLGTIPFKNIFQIMPLKETESKGKAYAFVIYVGSWQKKEKDMGIREFYFSAYSNDELEQWTTYMEFIRAKAIYDAFVNTFGKISFPLTNNALEKIDSPDDSSKMSHGMSRLAYMAQKPENTQNTYKSHTSSIRKSTMKSLNLRQKNKETMSNDANNSNHTETALVNYNAECQKKVKERLGQFFQSSLFQLWSQVFEMSGRHSRKNEDFMVLGNNTGFMKEKNHHFFFERTLFEDVATPQSLLDKRASKYNSSFSINGRSSITSFLNNSLNSEDDVNSNSPVMRTPPKIEKHQGNTINLALLKPLTSVDENEGEDIISPQVKFQKSFSLKTEEKYASNHHQIKSEGDINAKKSTRTEEFKLESLEKIEEVNDSFTRTRESFVSTTEKNFELGRENAKETNGIGRQRKSKFINMIHVDKEKNNENYATGKTERLSKDLNIDDLRNMPVLSTKIGKQTRYIEDKKGKNEEGEDFELVFKTKKGNFGNNDNYGDLFKINKEIESKSTSKNSIEVKKDDLMKELLKESVEEAIKDANFNGKQSSFDKRSWENEKKKSEIYREKENSLEKWEKDNVPNPNEESYYKTEVFSEKDYQFLNFPQNLGKQAKYFEENPADKPQEEEIVLKKKNERLFKL